MGNSGEPKSLQSAAMWRLRKKEISQYDIKEYHKPWITFKIKFMKRVNKCLLHVGHALMGALRPRLCFEAIGLCTWSSWGSLLIK